MPLGAGRYDEEVTELRERLKAQGILLLVVNGERGSGFSAQLSTDDVFALPSVLRQMADQIEGSGIDA